MLAGEYCLTPSERRELKDRMRSRTLPAEDVRRARLILLLAQGKSYLAIRQVLGCNPNYISRWKGRFEAERLASAVSVQIASTTKVRIRRSSDPWWVSVKCASSAAVFGPSPRRSAMPSFAAT